MKKYVLIVLIFIALLLLSGNVWFNFYFNYHPDFPEANSDYKTIAKTYKHDILVPFEYEGFVTSFHMLDESNGIETFEILLCPVKDFDHNEDYWRIFFNTQERLLLLYRLKRYVIGNYFINKKINSLDEINQTNKEILLSRYDLAYVVVNSNMINKYLPHNQKTSLEMVYIDYLDASIIILPTDTTSIREKFHSFFFADSFVTKGFASKIDSDTLGHIYFELYEPREIIDGEISRIDEPIKPIYQSDDSKADEFLRDCANYPLDCKYKVSKDDGKIIEHFRLQCDLRNGLNVKVHGYYDHHEKLSIIKKIEIIE